MRGGSAGQARSYGRTLLSKMVLPDGSKRIGPQPDLKPAETPGGIPHLVVVTRFFRVPMPISHFFNYLQSHPPAGTQLSGSGGASPPDPQAVFYAVRPTPAGIGPESIVLASTVPDPGGGTVLRADAFIAWYPPRSAAEYLKPSAFHSVTIQAYLGGPRPRTVGKTFTSEAVITRLARVLDSLHTLDSVNVLGCPKYRYSFSIKFARSAGSPPAALASQFGCSGDQITVRGKPQPTLEDGGSIKVFDAIAPLFGLRSSFW